MLIAWYSCAGALKTNVSVQLLCLSLTDLLVGIITIPTALVPTAALKYESCAILVYMYFLAQSATLCHTLLICVNRLLTIKRKTSIHENNNKTLKTIFIQIMAVWTGCILFFSIHFLAFARFGETITQCSTIHLFEDNHLVAFGLLTIPLLVSPQLCTNIIYAYLFIHIRQKLRLVSIVQVLPKYPVDNGGQQNYHVHEQHSTNCRTKGDMHKSHRSMVQSVSLVTKGSDSCMSNAQTKIRSINEQEASTSTAYKPKCFGINDSVKGGEVTRNSQTNNTRLGPEKQMRVLVTFGILLITLNIFVTPLDFVAIIEMIRNRPLSRSVRYVFVTMAMLNSAFNPIINIWRMKPFRVIMKKKATKIYELLRFWRT